MNWSEEQDLLLRHAVKNGDELRVRQLLARGANPNVADIVGNTPLHYAVIAQYPRVALVLLEFNADPTVKNSHCLTPGALAMHGEQRDFAELLGYSPPAVQLDFWSENIPRQRPRYG